MPRFYDYLAGNLSMRVSQPARFRRDRYGGVTCDDYPYASYILPLLSPAPLNRTIAFGGSLPRPHPFLVVVGALLPV